MDKKRKKELKKANNKKEFIEVEGKRLDRLAEMLLRDLGIEENDSREVILNKVITKE